VRNVRLGIAKTTKALAPSAAIIAVSFNTSKKKRTARTVRVASTH